MTARRLVAQTALLSGVAGSAFRAPRSCPSHPRGLAAPAPCVPAPAPSGWLAPAHGSLCVLTPGMRHPRKAGKSTHDNKGTATGDPANRMDNMRTGHGRAALIADRCLQHVGDNSRGHSPRSRKSAIRTGHHVPSCAPEPRSRNRPDTLASISGSDPAVALVLPGRGI